MAGRVPITPYLVSPYLGPLRADPFWIRDFTTTNTAAAFQSSRMIFSSSSEEEALYEENEYLVEVLTSLSERRRSILNLEDGLKHICQTRFKVAGIRPPEQTRAMTDESDEQSHHSASWEMYYPSLNAPFG